MSTTEKASLISQKATSRCWMFEAACSANQSFGRLQTDRSWLHKVCLTPQGCKLSATHWNLGQGHNSRQALDCQAGSAHSMEAGGRLCRVLTGRAQK